MGRYKQGTLEKVKTAKGWTWYLRYTDNTSATPKRPRERIGLFAEYPSQSRAWKAAEPILKRLNGPQTAPKLFDDLIDLYIEKKLPKRHSTRRGYQSIINAHIRPKWGNTPLEDVRSAPVEEWLLGRPVGNYRKGHILNVMRLLFKTAMHYEWLPLAANPMSTFSIEGSTKRSKQPGTLTVGQFHEILERIPNEPYRTMVVAAQCWGLRVSELFALRWSDVRFLEGKVTIGRAIVEGHVGPVKTAQSEAELPVHPYLAGILLAWMQLTEFKDPEHFIFASPWQAGELPYNASKIQSAILRTAGQGIGLPFELGWHTFRHTYRTLLRKTGAPMDVQRDLMRHADISITAKYGGTELDELTPINTMIVDSLFGRKQ
jgi:integrase